MWPLEIDGAWTEDVSTHAFVSRQAVAYLHYVITHVLKLYSLGYDSLQETEVSLQIWKLNILIPFRKLR